MEITLTLAIPTFNRAKFLDRCLNSFASQGRLSEMEIFISNNASTDNTIEVIEKYKSLFPNFSYVTNEINKGLDFNVSQCFERATGKYVWVMGDDDFILPNKLSSILDLIHQNDIGVVYLMPKENNPTLVSENADKGLKEVLFFDKPLSFFDEFHYWATFVSATIIHKDVIKNKVNPFRFKDTFLPQMAWVIPAVFSGNKNVIVKTPTIGCEPDNTGGYRLATVFGKNYNFILTELIKDKGIDYRIKSVTQNELFKNFFPRFINKLLYSKNDFKSENHFLILFKVGWSYKSYWESVFPIYLRFFVKACFPFLKRTRK